MKRVHYSYRSLLSLSNIRLNFASPKPRGITIQSKEAVYRSGASDDQFKLDWMYIMGFQTVKAMSCNFRKLTLCTAAKKPESLWITS